jgi:hypothetical protein
VDLEQISRTAFLDELEKIAVSRERLRLVAHDRRGTRPISVDNFLKKEKDGTLYKETGSKSKVASVTNAVLAAYDRYFEYALQKKAGDFAGTPVAVEAGTVDPNAVHRGRRKGEVPSMDDTEAVNRSDGRENATTTTGQGSTFNNIGATGNSAGGT